MVVAFPLGRQRAQVGQVEPFLHAERKVAERSPVAILEKERPPVRVATVRFFLAIPNLGRLVC